MAKKQKTDKIYDVQPLKTLEEIEDMKESLRRWCSERDRFLFIIGINTGLRVSDIVKLKVKDVTKERNIIIEQKTGKRRIITIKGQFRKEVDNYIKGMDPDEYLFPSRRKDGKTPHITPTQAYRQLVKAGNMIDRQDIGTHTMRKTFGYHHYKRNKDIAQLMEIFNHSSPSITKKYIGITQEEIDESLEDFYL
jgi:integrase